MCFAVEDRSTLDHGVGDFVGSAVGLVVVGLFAAISACYRRDAHHRHDTDKQRSQQRPVRPGGGSAHACGPWPLGGPCWVPELLLPGWPGGCISRVAWVGGG